jgi:hypothetical protein
MTRLPRGVAALVALLGLAAFAAGPAQAKTKRSHATSSAHGTSAHATSRGHAAPKRHVATSPYKFPNYISSGVDRNPGGDNLYFSDTKDQPIFNGPRLIGPAYFQRWWSTTY